MKHNLVCGTMRGFRASIDSIFVWNSLIKIQLVQTHLLHVHSSKNAVIAEYGFNGKHTTYMYMYTYGVFKIHDYSYDG